MDIAIVGSGFGGSLLAMICRRMGLSAILIERGAHPRFAIGESTSPLANLLIEEIANRYDLPRLLPLTTYGAWKSVYPQVCCGLKRGFSFFHHTAGEPFRTDHNHTNQLLVAASPRDEISDMHWLRADVDQFLLQEAIALGSEYVDRTLLSQVAWSGDGATLQGERGGERFSCRARLVIDASGPHGFLSRLLGLPEAGFAGYPQRQGLYSHFTGVRRCDSLPAFQTADAPPYPLDDAALHHCCDGGWMWVLRFDSGVVSAGISVSEELAEELRLSEGEAAWQRFLRRFPTIAEQFANAVPTRPFSYMPRIAYRSSTATGDGWAMLPSAASFVDPLFSTGIAVTLLGIERLGHILAESFGTAALTDRLTEYGDITLEEAGWTARYIAGCHAAMSSFPEFGALSMFYFAAASFSEMARRLDRRDLVRRLLAADHPAFAAGLRECSDLLRGRDAAHEARDAAFAERFEKRVAAAVEPLNVAGLCDPGRKNWYPVDLEDVVRGAGKLGFESAEMRAILGSATWV